MILQLRRKRQITVRRNQATTNSRGWSAAFSFAILLLAVASSAEAQEAELEKSARSYPPPVHIPPRKTVHDPGLPQTLNGKFNSVQRIESDSSRGLKTRISDSQMTYESSTPQMVPTDVPRVARQNSTPPNGNYRRRSGLQNQFSSLFGVRNRPNSMPASRGGNAVGKNASRVHHASPNETGNPFPKQQSSQLAQRTSATTSSVANHWQKTKSQIQSVFNQSSMQRRGVPQRSPNSMAMNRNPIQSGKRIQPSANRIASTVPSNRKMPPRQFASEAVQATNFEMPRESAEGDVARLKSSYSKIQESGFQNLRVPAKPVSVLSRSNEMELDPPASDEFEMELPEPVEIQDRTFNNVNSNRRNNVLRQPAGLIQDDEFGYDDEDDDTGLLNKSCEEFREELLNDPITNIALDLSPPAQKTLSGEREFRVWRDQHGNELTRGSIADLRRGYVIVDTGSGLVRLPYARLSDADWLVISDFWGLPVECGLGPGKYFARCWAPQTVTWHASAVCHKPLYFENIQLERYGHSHGPFIQPVASTVHFFGKLFFLPYNTAINPPNECQYALGFYRPGNCAPWLKDPFPISLSGASRQSLIYTGVGFLAD